MITTIFLDFCFIIPKVLLELHEIYEKYPYMKYLQWSFCHNIQNIKQIPIYIPFFFNRTNP